MGVARIKFLKANVIWYSKGAFAQGRLENMFFFVADAVYRLTQHLFLTLFLLPTLLRKPRGAKYFPSLSALEVTGWQLTSKI